MEVVLTRTLILIALISTTRLEAQTPVQIPDASRTELNLQLQRIAQSQNGAGLLVASTPGVVQIRVRDLLVGDGERVSIGTNGQLLVGIAGKETVLAFTASENGTSIVVQPGVDTDGTRTNLILKRLRAHILKGDLK